MPAVCKFVSAQGGAFEVLFFEPDCDGAVFFTARVEHSHLFFFEERLHFRRGRSSGEIQISWNFTYSLMLRCIYIKPSIRNQTD